MVYRNCLIFIQFYSILLFLVLEIGVSVDQNFEACLPINCGQGPNISYPFWIDGRQNSTCGFPGFVLSCKNREPILRHSNEEYTISEIEYKDQSIFIKRLGLSGSICSPETYRVNYNHLLFSIVPSDVNLSLFFNCTDLSVNENDRYSFGCDTGNSRRRDLAMLSNDSMLKYVNESRKCENQVEMHVDVSENRSLNTPKVFVDEFLEKGFHLKWNATRCDECSESGGRCGFNYTTYKFMCFCPGEPQQRRCTPTATGTNMQRKLEIALGTGIGSVLVAVILFLCWKRRHHSFKSKISWKRNNKDQRLVEIFLKNCGSMAPKRYSYLDIKKMTSSFKDKIGQGGYGEVYKGKMFDGHLVAVKLLNKAKGNGEDFINEVASISRTSHVNIVSLLGFCFDGTRRALVYEFMANGSLEKFIHDHNSLEAQSQLGWETLFQIATGVARGLEYLHRGCNALILHFDIKPHNILLDQNFFPKISDFGLAKLYSRNESITSMLNARGTAGYIAPEMFNRNFGRVSHKSDVYSYGMMVLEMVGKRKNIDVVVDHTSEIYFPQWIYKRLELDEDLGVGGFLSEAEVEITRKMILVALWCIQTNPVDRPAMSRVVEMLEGKLEQLSIPPKPYLCSPPRSPQSSSSKLTDVLILEHEQNAST